MKREKKEVRFNSRVGLIFNLGGFISNRMRFILIRVGMIF
jgi:hypothetical protein